MRRLTSRRAAIVLALLALASAPPRAKADLIATLTEATTQSGGVYTYTYTLTVGAASTVAATELDISSLGPIDESSVVMPTDFFESYSAADSEIQFLYYGTGAGIGPGSSGIFSFNSTTAPGIVNAAVGNYNTSGTIVTPLAGPSSVPEPSSLLMCGLGALGAVGWAHRGRRRTAS